MISTNTNRCTLWKAASTARSSEPVAQDLPVPGPGGHPVNVFKITPRRLLIGGSALLTVTGFYLYTRDLSSLHGSIKPSVLPEVPQTVVAEANALATPVPQLAVVNKGLNGTFRVLPFPDESQPE